MDVAARVFFLAVVHGLKVAEEVANLRIETALIGVQAAFKPGVIR